MLGANRNDRGSVLLIVIILMIVVIGMTGAFLTVASTHKSATVTGQQLEHATAVAEAGLDDTIYRMNAWTAGTLAWPGPPVSTNTGSVSTGTFSVTIEPPFNPAVVQDYKLTATGTIGKNSKAITDIVTASSNSAFGYAMFGLTGVTLSGGVFTDAYNSSMGSYTSQQVNYDSVHRVSYADPKGTVGSNGNITASGATTVYGPATPGVAPTYSYSGSGGAYVYGSTASETSPVTFPPATYTPSPAASAGSYRPGTTTIPAGTYHYSDFTTSGSDRVTFTGSVTLYIDGKIDVSGSSVLALAAGASVVIRQGGGGPIHISGGGVVNPANLPSNFQIYSTNDTSSNPSYDVQFSGGTNLFATLYAPNAKFKPSGGTSFYGSFIANYIDDSGGAAFHYDEALAGSGGAAKYKTKLWFDTDR